MKDPLWVPSKERIRDSLMYEFMQVCPENLTLISTYMNGQLEIWKVFGLSFGIFLILNIQSHDSVLKNPVMPGAEWFSGSELNYAENYSKEIRIR